jgi:hypothetical protein
MSPSSAIIAAAAAVQTVTDVEGRRLTLRRLTALDRLRLFKAAGPVLAQNQPWLGMAVLASSVAAIDDVPMPQPVNEMQIEAMIGRLGDAGTAAIAQALQQDASAAVDDVVDSAGTEPAPRSDRLPVSGSERGAVRCRLQPATG